MNQSRDIPAGSKRLRRLRVEVHALYLALGDARTPWYARAVALAVVAYAVSPIDLIPDFIPVLGHLDDLLLLPLGLALARRLVPPEVLEEARARAQDARPPSLRARWLAAVLVLLLWIALCWWALRALHS